MLGINEDPVSIRILEWNIIDRGFDEGLVTPILPVVQTGKTVAIVGLEDVVVVDTDDALLVLPRSRSQDVREVVEALRRARKTGHL